MTVKEYREQNPHCKLCKHGKYILHYGRCLAKEKRIIFNKAKTCPLYDPRERFGSTIYDC